MKKYFEVVIITFKAQIAYRFDVFIGVIVSFLRVILAYIMWSAIFLDKKEVGTFTLSMMITYYIASSFLKRLDCSDSILWQLSGEIREGQFTKYLLKPIEPIWYFVASSFSKTVFILGINLFAACICTLIFHNYFVLTVNLHLLFWGMGINILGLVFLVLFSYSIAILSLKFIDIGPLNMIRNNIVEFLTGTLIPLSLLPIWIQNAMKLFPFYYIYYLPVMLFIGRKEEEIPVALATLLFWNMLILFVDLKLYKGLIKSYEGVGI
ncbi:MAG TPA: ABC-2 family transporter protein [Clostridiaceae bacterium]